MLCRSAILQVHPTRRCNLTCRHCYSRSGPSETDQITVDRLCAAIDDAVANGYTTLAVSGGEPLLYSGLAELLAHARSRGMTTTLTTNGTLLSKQRLESLCGSLDLMAISIDGAPETHNRIRGHPRAFQRVMERLDDVRGSGIPFGLICTVTRLNLGELDQVADLAVDKGASLIQLHPIEPAGRANNLMAQYTLCGRDQAIAYLAANAIRRRHESAIQVQLDLITRNQLRRITAQLRPATGQPDCPLARLISPLVIEPDGRVAPLRYGFSDRFALGNLHREPLRVLAARWKQNIARPFAALIDSVAQHENDLGTDTWPLLNWFEAMDRAATQSVQAAT